MRRRLWLVSYAWALLACTSAPAHRGVEAVPHAAAPSDAGEMRQATNERLLPVFMPSLASLLLARERAKGSPLTREEVLQIRDKATAVMVPESRVPAIAERRGYDDVDPERCWEDWQRLRPSLQSPKE